MCRSVFYWEVNGRKHAQCGELWMIQYSSSVTENTEKQASQVEFVSIGRTKDDNRGGRIA